MLTWVSSFSSSGRDRPNFSSPVIVGTTDSRTNWAAKMRSDAVAKVLCDALVFLRVVARAYTERVRHCAALE